MNLYFRFIWLLIRHLFSAEKISILEPCRTRFWVNPMDLDVNLHMNNGRYLSIMDLGRTDLMLKAGVFNTLFFNGYYPVVVSESIRFKKSLDPFQFFYIETQVEAWNAKDFYLRQSFIRKEKGQDVIVAEGYIKGRFLKRGRKGSIPTLELFKVMGVDLDPSKNTGRSQAQDQIEKELIPTSPRV